MSALQIVEAIAELTGRIVEALRQRTSTASSRLREMVAPTEEIELVTRDGRRFTGVFVLSGGRVLAMLAIEVPRAPNAEPAPPPARHEPLPGYGRQVGLSRFDEQSELWGGHRY